MASQTCGICSDGRIIDPSSVYFVLYGLSNRSFFPVRGIKLPYPQEVKKKTHGRGQTWATGPLSAELLLEGVKEGLAAANLSMFDLTGLRTVLTILAPFFSITVLTLEGISFWTLEVKVEKTEGLIGGLGTGTLDTNRPSH